jgi:hypothetical protein
MTGLLACRSVSGCGGAGRAAGSVSRPTQSCGQVPQRGCVARGRRDRAIVPLVRGAVPKEVAARTWPVVRWAAASRRRPSERVERTVAIAVKCVSGSVRWPLYGAAGGWSRLAADDHGVSGALRVRGRLPRVPGRLTLARRLRLPGLQLSAGLGFSSGATCGSAPAAISRRRSPPAPSCMARAHRSGSGSGPPIWWLPTTPASRPSSSSAGSACLATRPPG